jgi:hypothetical protein
MSMGWNTHQRAFSSATAVIVAGLLSVQGALAAPPLRPQQWQLPRLQASPQPARSSGQAHMPASGSMQTPPQLDLRAPSHMPEVADNAADRSFPSRRPNVAAQEAVQLPALGTEGVRARPTVQEFVRRVHQEGLPVARLFEGKSALVHLGLNPKGKPGLWLVQKTR